MPVINGKYVSLQEYQQHTYAQAVATKRLQHTIYHQKHSCCPLCGSYNIRSTTMGTSPEYDHNRASCGECAWAGIVHDLVEGKTNGHTK